MKSPKNLIARVNKAALSLVCVTSLVISMAIPGVAFADIAFEGLEGQTVHVLFGYSGVYPKSQLNSSNHSDDKYTSENSTGQNQYWASCDAIFQSNSSIYVPEPNMPKEITLTTNLSSSLLSEQTLTATFNGWTLDVFQNDISFCHLYQNTNYLSWFYGNGDYILPSDGTKVNKSKDRIYGNGKVINIKDFSDFIHPDSSYNNELFLRFVPVYTINASTIMINAIRYSTTKPYNDYGNGNPIVVPNGFKFDKSILDKFIEEANKTAALAGTNWDNKWGCVISDSTHVKNDLYVRDFNDFTMTLQNQALTFGAAYFYPGDIFDVEPPKPKSTSTSSTVSNTNGDIIRKISATGESNVLLEHRVSPAHALAGATMTANVSKTTSGKAYEQLNKSAGDKRIGDIYNINLKANGNPYNKDFGELIISLPVPSEYEGRRLIVSHRFSNDERIEKFAVTVINGFVTFTVTELSWFAIEIDSSNTGNVINTTASSTFDNAADNTNRDGADQVVTDSQNETQAIAEKSSDAQQKDTSAGGLLQTGDPLFTIASALVLVVLMCIGFMKPLRRRLQIVGPKFQVFSIATSGTFAGGVGETRTSISSLAATLGQMSKASVSAKVKDVLSVK